MKLPVEEQLRAVVGQADAVHALAEAGLAQHLDGVVLQDAGADAVLGVVARAGLDDDALDAREVEQVREQQAGRACSDDSDLRSHSSAPLDAAVWRFAGVQGRAAGGWESGTMRMEWMSRPRCRKSGPSP